MLVTGLVKLGKTFVINISKNFMGQVMDETSYNDTRLVRIEEKLDKMAEAMISLARAEEKLINMETKYNSQYDRMNKFSVKLDLIEKQTEAQAHSMGVINKLFWVVIVAVASAIAAQIWM